MKGFQTKIQAMQFEWAVKHEAPRNVGGLDSRMKKLAKVLTKERWTSNSPASATVAAAAAARVAVVAAAANVAYGRVPGALRWHLQLA